MIVAASDYICAKSAWIRALLARRGARRRSRRRAVEQCRSAARFRCQIELVNILIVAAAPIGDKVFGAAVGRIAHLHRVDGKCAGRLGIIASAYQQGRDITDLHQIGLAGRRHEIAAG
jgi:hypothetical protein